MYSPTNTAVSVSEINQYIATLMERDDVLSYISVRGEISNFKRHASGHLYFSLKDEGGVLRSVMFRGDVARLSCHLADGVKVIAHGQIRNYVATGQYQLYVRHIDIDGKGDLHAAFEALKKKLADEGLFDTAHKRELPPYPSVIGIVTSPTGAAIRDMLQILARRYPLAQVELYPALVQGQDAPATLIRGIEYFSARKPDLVIIGRGGGSIEDLWCFNDENLARAICACEVPVISAVGHEIDFTISDFVADLRAPTPSAAAELAVPDRADLQVRLSDALTAAKRGLTGQLKLARLKLDAYRPEQLQKHMTYAIGDRTVRLSQLDDSIRRSVKDLYDRSSASLTLCVKRLDALNPLAVLSRGYTVTETADGSPLNSVENVTAGDVIQTLTCDGTIRSQVQEVRKEPLHGNDI